MWNRLRVTVGLNWDSIMRGNSTTCGHRYRHDDEDRYLVV